MDRERDWLLRFAAQARGWTTEQVAAAMRRDLAVKPEPVRKYMSKCCLAQIELEAPGSGDLATVCSNCKRRVGHV